METKNLKRFAAMLSFVLLVSCVAGGLSIVQAQTYPRDETLVLGGDMSYCGMGFNPYGIPGTNCNRALSLTYMSLFWYNWTSGTLQSWLALSYQWSLDGLTFIIHLRSEAMWRDGTPVTSADAVFDFLTEDEYGSYPIDHSIVESVTAPDSYTVDFNLMAGAKFSNHVLSYIQDVPIFEKARWQQLLVSAVANPTDIQSYMNENFEQIDSNGPYVPVFAGANETVLERVDNWWGNSIFVQPAPKYVMLVNHPTNDQEQADFSSGAVDWDDSYFSGIYSYLMSHSDVVVWNRNDLNGRIFNSAGAVYMVPNINSKTHPELTQPWLRQAVAYAISVTQIDEEAEEGLVMPASPSFITPTGPMADEYIDYNLINSTYGNPNYIPFDPLKAIQILQQHCSGSVSAGWTWNGTPIGPWNIYTVSGWSDVNLMSTLVSEDLQNIGIKMNVNIVSENVYDDLRHAMNFDWLDFTSAIDNSPSPTFPVSNFDNLFIGDPALDQDPCNYTASPNCNEVSNLITELWNLQIGSNESIAVAKQIQQLVVSELPYIPLFVQVPWTRYNTNYWTGWPTTDNPGPGQGSSWWEDVIPQVILMLKQASPMSTASEPSLWILVEIGIGTVIVLSIMALVIFHKKPKTPI